MRWAERQDGIRLIERRAIPPLGHFSLIRFGKVDPTAMPAAQAGLATAG
jgi:phosphatidylethanolamine/phosphatidyl-N-methylethanolamine N-methyltransferase